MRDRSDRSRWVEVTNCNKCGFKIIKPWNPRPYSLFGSKQICPEGKFEFVVSWSILSDKDDDGGMLEELTHKAMSPQRTLEEWLV